MREFKTQVKVSEARISMCVSDELLKLEKISSIPIECVNIRIDRVMKAGEKTTYHYTISTQVEPNFKEFYEQS